MQSRVSFGSLTFWTIWQHLQNGCLHHFSSAVKQLLPYAVLHHLVLNGTEGSVAFFPPSPSPSSSSSSCAIHSRLSTALGTLCTRKHSTAQQSVALHGSLEVEVEGSLTEQALNQSEETRSDGSRWNVAWWNELAPECTVTVGLQSVSVAQAQHKSSKKQ